MGNCNYRVLQYIDSRWNKLSEWRFTGNGICRGAPDISFLGFWLRLELMTEVWPKLELNIHQENEYINDKFEIIQPADNPAGYFSTIGIAIVLESTSKITSTRK